MGATHCVEHRSDYDGYMGTGVEHGEWERHLTGRERLCHAKLRRARAERCVAGGCRWYTPPVHDFVGPWLTAVVQAGSVQVGMATAGKSFDQS